MKNINNADIKIAVCITIGEESMFLTEGQVVTIITDDTDFDLKYQGIINFISVDMIEVNGEMIDFEYIKEIII